MVSTFGNFDQRLWKMHKNKNAVLCVVEVIQNCYRTEIGSVVDPSVRCEDCRLSMVPEGYLYFCAAIVTFSEKSTYKTMDLAL